MTLPSKIRVLLADDQTMIRQGFAYVIGLQADLELVGEAADGVEAVELAGRLRPDVILMDVQMPRMTGIEAIRAIGQTQPETKMVILTTFDDQDYIYESIRAGAVGFLLKDADVEEMLGAVRAACRGEAVYKSGHAALALRRAAADVAQAAGAEAAQEATPSLAEPLTEREREILQEMAYGLRNDQIARKLYIAEGTVKSHVHRILQKLGCEDRTQAVVLALRGGLAK